MSTKRIVELPSGKRVLDWSDREIPNVNQWYLTKDTGTDFWKIQKDFFCEDTNETYFKIVEYYDGMIMYSAETLTRCRMLMRENTYRSVI